MHLEVLPYSADHCTCMLPRRRSPLQALRVLRAIKPLRALTRSAGMQLIFKSLTLSLAAMGNVSIVVMLSLLIFSFLGVNVRGCCTRACGTHAGSLRC